MLNYNFTINRMCFEGKEPKGFYINRTKGTQDWLFIQFKSRGIISINDKTQNYSAGDCILLRPGTAHSFLADESLVHDWIHFMPASPDFYNYKISFDKLVKHFYAFKLSEITHNLHKEFIAKDDGKEEYINCLLKEMMILLSREKTEGKLYSRRERELKESFIILRQKIFSSEYLDSSIENLAGSVCLSKSRFTHLYTIFFNNPPVKDLIAARIERAKTLLSKMTFSVSEVAEKCGYNDVYSFIRQFKRATGVSPGKWHEHQKYG